MHHAAKAVIVVDRVVLGAAIVPQRDRAGLPAETAGEFRARRVGEKIAEQRRALLDRHVLEAQRVPAIGVERLAAGLGMRAHHRMLGDILLPRVGLRAVAHAVLARLRDVGLGGGIHHDEPVEHAPHAVRQRLVGAIHVGEQRIAAARRRFARDQHGRHRRALEIGRVGVPQTAEIDLLVLELDHRRDLRKALETLHERIFDRLAEAACGVQELRGRQRLLAKEDDEVLQPRGADGRDGVVAEIVSKVDADDLGPQRAGERPDVERVGSHGGTPVRRGA